MPILRPERVRPTRVAPGRREGTEVSGLGRERSRCAVGRQRRRQLWGRCGCSARSAHTGDSGPGHVRRHELRRKGERPAQLSAEETVTMPGRATLHSEDRGGGWQGRLVRGAARNTAEHRGAWPGSLGRHVEDAGARPSTGPEGPRPGAEQHLLCSRPQHVPREGEGRGRATEAGGGAPT